MSRQLGEGRAQLSGSPACLDPTLGVGEESDWNKRSSTSSVWCQGQDVKRGEAVGAGKAVIAVKVSGEGREDGPSLMILMLRGKHSPQGVGGKKGNRGMLANATRLRALSSVAGGRLTCPANTSDPQDWSRIRRRAESGPRNVQS